MSDDVQQRTVSCLDLSPGMATHSAHHRGWQQNEVAADDTVIVSQSTIYYFRNCTCCVCLANVDK